jgi:hypothetical protein
VGHLEGILKGKVADNAQFVAQLTAQGYRSQRTAEGTTEVVHELSGARFATKELQPNGQAIGPQLVATIERTQRQVQEQTQKRGQSPRIG